MTSLKNLFRHTQKRALKWLRCSEKTLRRRDRQPRAEVLEKRIALSVNTVYQSPGANDPWVTVVTDYGSDVYLSHVGDSARSLLVANNSSFLGDVTSPGVGLDGEQVVPVSGFNQNYATLVVSEGEPLPQAGLSRADGYPSYGNGDGLQFVLSSANADDGVAVSGTLKVGGKFWDFQTNFSFDAFSGNHYVTYTSPQSPSVTALIDLGQDARADHAVLKLYNVISSLEISPGDDVELTRFFYDTNPGIGYDPATNYNLLPARNDAITIDLFDQTVEQTYIPGTVRGSGRISVVGTTVNVGFNVSPDGEVKIWEGGEGAIGGRSLTYTSAAGGPNPGGDRDVIGRFNAATGEITLSTAGPFGFEVLEADASVYDVVDATATQATLFNGFDHGAGLRMYMPSPNSRVSIDAPIDAQDRIGGVARQSLLDVVLSATYVEVSSPITTVSQFQIPKANASFYSGITESIQIHSPIDAPRAEVFLADNSATSTPNRSQLWVTRGGAILDSSAVNSRSASVYVDVEVGDILVDGQINAINHTYILKSAAADSSRFKAPFRFATGSYSDGLGEIIGGTALVMLGNDVFGEFYETTTFSNVTLSTDVDNLRVRAGSRRGDEAQAPFPYEITIRDKSSLTVETVTASSRGIDLRAENDLILSAAMRSGGDLRLAAGGLLDAQAPIETAFGFIEMVAPNVSLGAGVAVLDTLVDERRTDIQVRATGNDVEDSQGNLVSPSLLVRNSVRGINRVEFISERGSIGGEGLVIADALIATAAEGIVLNTAVHRAEALIKPIVARSPGETGVVALYEQDYFLADVNNAATVVLVADGDDMFMEAEDIVTPSIVLSPALLATVGESSSFYVSAPNGSIDVTVGGSKQIALGLLEDTDRRFIQQLNPLFSDELLDGMKVAGSVRFVSEDAERIKVYDAPQALSGSQVVRFATSSGLLDSGAYGPAKLDSGVKLGTIRSLREVEYWDEDNGVVAYELREADVKWRPGEPGFDFAEVEFSLPVVQAMQLVGFDYEIISGNPNRPTDESLQRWNEQFRASDTLLVKDGMLRWGYSRTASMEINGLYQISSINYEPLSATGYEGTALMKINIVRMGARDQSAELNRAHYVTVSGVAGAGEDQYFLSSDGVGFTGPDYQPPQATVTDDLGVEGNFYRVELDDVAGIQIGAAVSASDVGPLGKFVVEIDASLKTVLLSAATTEELETPIPSPSILQFTPPEHDTYTKIKVTSVPSKPGYTSVRTVSTSALSAGYTEPDQLVTVEQGQFGLITSRIQQSIAQASEVFGGVELEMGDLVLVQFGTEQDQTNVNIPTSIANGVYRVVDVGRDKNALGLNGAPWKLARYAGIDENGDGAADAVFTGVVAVDQGWLRTRLTGMMFEYSYDAVNNGTVLYEEIKAEQQRIIEKEADPIYYYDRADYYETVIDTELLGGEIELVVSRSNGGNSDGGTMGRMLDLLQQNKTEREVLLTFDTGKIQSDSGENLPVVHLTEELPALVRSVYIDGNGVIVDGAGIVKDRNGEELRLSVEGRYFGPVRPSEVAYARRRTLTKPKVFGEYAGGDGLSFGEGTSGSVVKNIVVGGFENGSAFSVQGASNILFENVQAGAGPNEFIGLQRRLPNAAGFSVIGAEGEKGGFVTLRNTYAFDSEVGVDLRDGTESVRVIESYIGAENFENGVGVRVGSPEGQAASLASHSIGLQSNGDATQIIEQNAVLADADEYILGAVGDEIIVRVAASLLEQGLRTGMNAYDRVNQLVWEVTAIRPAEEDNYLHVTLALNEKLVASQATVKPFPVRLEFGVMVALEKGSSSLKFVSNGFDYRNLFLGQTATFFEDGYFIDDPIVRKVETNDGLGVEFYESALRSGYAFVHFNVPTGRNYVSYNSVGIELEGPSVQLFNTDVTESSATGIVLNGLRPYEANEPVPGQLSAWPLVQIGGEGFPITQAADFQPTAKILAVVAGVVENKTAEVTLDDVSGISDGDKVFSVAGDYLGVTVTAVNEENKTVEFTEPLSLAVGSLLRFGVGESSLDEREVTQITGSDAIKIDSLLGVSIGSKVKTLGASGIDPILIGTVEGIDASSNVITLSDATDIPTGSLLQFELTTTTNSDKEVVNNVDKVRLDDVLGISVDDKVFSGAGVDLGVTVLAVNEEDKAVVFAGPVILAVGSTLRFGDGESPLDETVREVQGVSKGIQLNSLLGASVGSEVKMFGQSGSDPILIGTVEAIDASIDWITISPETDPPIPNGSLLQFGQFAERFLVDDTSAAAVGNAYVYSGAASDRVTIRNIDSVRNVIRLTSPISVDKEAVSEIGFSRNAATRRWSEPTDQGVAVFANRGAGITLSQELFDEVGKQILGDDGWADPFNGQFDSWNSGQLANSFQNYVLIAGNFIGTNLLLEDGLANGSGNAKNIEGVSLSGRAAAFADLLFTGYDNATESYRFDHDGDGDQVETSPPYPEIITGEDFNSLPRYRAVFRPENFESVDFRAVYQELGVLDPGDLLDAAKIAELESIQGLDSFGNFYSAIPKYTDGDPDATDPTQPVGGSTGGTGGGTDTNAGPGTSNGSPPDPEPEDDLRPGVDF